MISGLLCIFIFIRSRLNPALVGLPRDGRLNGQTAAEANSAPARENVKQMETLVAEELPTAGAGGWRNSLLLRAFAPALLILVVFSSMYTGLATADECAGIGAVGALLIVILLGRLDKRMFVSSLAAAARTSVMILFMAICGFALTYIVSYLGIASVISAAIAASGLNKWIVLILVYILWLILGCLMDPGSMVILTIPFMLPALNALGFDTIWLGVVSTLMVEVGMVTPPVGLNLFVCKTITGLPFSVLMRGMLPFLAVFGLALLLLTVFPQIALVIPNNM
jgi:TRAP-type C4-dicarboxylate transport system permease large subunit